MSVIAVDFDHTLWDTEEGRPMEGARDAISLLRERGHKIIIHSCNSPNFIKKCLDDADIRYDSIWDRMGKPVADAYLDDKSVRFIDWGQAVGDVLEMLEEVS